MPHDKDQTHWHEPAGAKKAGFGEFRKQPTPYDAFMQSEGIPVFRDIGIGKVQNLPLMPWKRTGGRAPDGVVRPAQPRPRPRRTRRTRREAHRLHRNRCQ